MPLTEVEGLVTQMEGQTWAKDNRASPHPTNKFILLCSRNVLENQVYMYRPTCHTHGEAIGA